MLRCQCPSVCDGSALAHYSSFRFQIPIPIYRALRSRCMRARGKGSSPGRVEGSSCAMLATARHSCLLLVKQLSFHFWCLTLTLNFIFHLFPSVESDEDKGEGIGEFEPFMAT